MEYWPAVAFTFGLIGFMLGLMFVALLMRFDDIRRHPLTWKPIGASPKPRLVPCARCQSLDWEHVEGEVLDGKETLRCRQCRSVMLVTPGDAEVIARQCA